MLQCVSRGLQGADGLMLFIGKKFFFHHLLGKTSLSGSVGKALGSPLVLQLTALQVCCLEEDFFSIGGDLASQSLE